MRRMELLMVLAVVVLTLQAVPASAYPVSGWTSIYAGIERADGMATSPRLMRAFALRIDLTNPYVSSRLSQGNGGAPYDVNLQGTDAFLGQYGCKVATNACHWDVNTPAPYADVLGLLMVGGQVVSPAGGIWPTQLNFRTSDHTGYFIASNSNPTDTWDGLETGPMILVDGVVQPYAPAVNPYTGFGLSADGKQLYMVCVDGRQPGWSDGCTYAELGQWMKDFGAWNAVHADGGGSTCMVRQDIGVVNRPCYGYVRTVAVSLGFASADLIHPPYLFPSNNMGWTPGNGVSGIAWTGSPTWTGSMYFDQLANDGSVISPPINFTTPYAPECFNVDLYPQSGSSASHDMKMYWQTSVDHSWTEAKSTPLVNYTAQNAWTSVNLSLDNANYWGRRLSQLRLDVDAVSKGTRFIVNHVVKQGAFWYHFSSDTMGWTAINALTVPYIETCCGWPGVLVTDQTANDAHMRVSVPINGDWPFHYLGGANDKIHVRVYPQNGNSASHDMAIYWTHEGDGAEKEAMSTHVNFTGQNQWCDVILPVGQNANWVRKHITSLRLDFDQTNHSTRWIVDYIRSEY